MDRDSLLLAKEVSKILKISLPTVYRLTRSGALKAVKIGNGWRYRKGDIDTYFRNIDRVLLETQIKVCTHARAKNKKSTPELTAAYRTTMNILSKRLRSFQKSSSQKSPRK